MKGAKTNNKRNKKAKGGLNGTDIPARPKRTIETISVAFPRATDNVMVHAVTSNVVTIAPTAATAASYNYTIAGSTATTGNFDQYRMVAVRFSIVPQNNAIGLVTAATTSLTNVYCVIDYDDSTNLTSVAQAEGYNNCVVVGPGESMMRTFRPRMALAAYAGAFNGFASSEPMWIDSVSSGVQHYGIKLYIPGVTAAQTQLQSWTFITEYAWELRNNLA